MRVASFPFGRSGHLLNFRPAGAWRLLIDGGEDCRQVYLLAGREESCGDFLGIRELVVVAAVLQVYVEGLKRSDPETGVSDLLDAGYRVRLGLFLGELYRILPTGLTSG